MPIYEYQCTACQHQLEAFQSLSEAPLTDCPACQQATLIKLISAAGFQLKGSGWYLTDYSAKGKRESSEKTSKEGTETSSNATTSTSTSTDSTSSSTGTTT